MKMVTKYVATDGKEFLTPSECKKYEEKANAEVVKANVNFYTYYENERYFTFIDIFTKGKVNQNLTFANFIYIRNNSKEVRAALEAFLDYHFGKEPFTDLELYNKSDKRTVYYYYHGAWLDLTCAFGHLSDVIDDWEGD